LHLIGYTLFANKSGSYAWGAAALVHMYDDLNDASKSSGRQLTGYSTLQIIIIELNFFYSLMLTILLIFVCFENMCSVRFMSIFHLFFRLLLRKIIMKENHVSAVGLSKGITSVDLTKVSR